MAVSANNSFTRGLHTRFYINFPPMAFTTGGTGAT
jgi:hypothetical protein